MKATALRERLMRAAAGDGEAFSGHEGTSLELNEDNYTCGELLLRLTLRSTQDASGPLIALPSSALPMLP